MKQLKGKRCLVTGAAGGIGRAIAMKLAEAGAHLWLLDVDEANLASTVAQAQAAGVDAVGHRCNLRSPTEVDTCIQKLLETWGGVDVLVNNAGVGQYGRTEHASAEQWEMVLSVNLAAPIQITRLLLPSLLEREESHILNVCSILGLVAGKRMTAYHTSKFALVGFSRALRAEFVRRGLGVTALCPGFVQTNIYKSAAEVAGSVVPPPPRWMLTTAEHVARVAVGAIRANRGVVTVTPAAALLWRLDRYAPGLVDFLQRTPWRKRRKRPKPQLGK